MDIRDFLSRLDGVQRCSENSAGYPQWQARCPAHDDRKASLSVSVSRDGKILCDCKAGCSTDDIVRSLGLQMKDLMPERKKEDRSVEAEYVYQRNEAGEPVLEKVKVRYADGSKQFFWKQLQGGRWVWNRNGIDFLPLYGRESLKYQAQAFVVEGEKDVDTMLRLGYPCVTLPDGGGKKKKFDARWKEYFKGLDVYILPDNDAAGREYAEILTDNLRDVASKLYVLDLRSAWADIPEKADITDLVNYKGEEAAVRSLMDMIKNAQRLPPEKYSAVPASEFGEDQTDFVWYPYIPIGDYTVLMSPGGTGKTYFTCGIAAAISKGEELPGDYRPAEPGTVLIISAEDRGEMLRKRLEASGADLHKVLIIDCMASVGMDFSDSYEEFKATIKRYSPKLVIVDPWHAFLGDNVDINRVNVVRPRFQRLANIAKELNCGMILISHVNKRAQGENVNNAATGSTDFVNAARSALYIIFDEDDDDCRIAVHTKSNYARYGDSVKFRIVKGGVVWDGFSQIDRQTMEQAARQKKTPGEVINSSENRQKAKEMLVKSLLAIASPVSDVRYTYDDFKERFGEEIFGTIQPKRALDAAAEDMLSRNYRLITGIQVKRDGKKGNGFLIRPLSKEDEFE